MSVALSFFGACVLSVSGVLVTPLDGTWSFLRERSKAVWEKVTVPHDWAIAGPFDRKYSSNTAMLPWKGRGRYRRTFDIPVETYAALASGARAYLEFGGVMARPRVTLNGKDVGGWDYGYMSFALDVTTAVRVGANEVEVTADTRDLASRWYPGGGFYRNARFVVRPADAVKPGTLFISTSDVSAQLAGVSVRYETVSGKAVARDFTVRSPHLWDVEDPHLYTLEVAGERFRYGIRRAEFKADDGFWLNGRRVELKGVNLHADLGPVGMAFDRNLARRQLKLMKDMGANALRTSHNPPDPVVLDLCDEMGILVWDEAFDKWGPHAGRRADENLEEYVGRNLEAMVRRDRNHPSVIVWSIGNEIWEPGSLEPNRKTREPYADGMTEERCRIFRDRIRALDPTRPVGAGFCHERYLKADHLAPLDLTGWNYRRRYAAMKARYPEKPVVYSESASAFSTLGYYDLPPASGRGDYATNDVQISGYDHCSSLGADIPDIEFYRLDTDRYCAGEFVWTGIDYLGEPSPFALNGARSSYFGIMDLCGNPKDRYWLYRARWNAKAETIHLVPSHWNLKAFATSSSSAFSSGQSPRIPVYVYTSGDEAELFLNGVSLGRRRKSALEPDELLPGGASKRYAFAESFKENPYYSVTDRYRLRWLEVAYAPGTLTAVAYRKGRKIGEARVETVGDPVALAIDAERSETPEGAFFVHVRPVDAAGRIVRFGVHRVNFLLTGPGRIVAAANGDPTELMPFSSVASYPMFAGCVSLVIRPERGRKGPLELEVSAEGLGKARAIVRP